MQFNADKFERAKFEPRTKRVKVEALADFFDGLEPGQVPEWEVRGLTATELFRTIEASARQGTIDTILKAIASKAEQLKVMRDAIGLTPTGTPGEIAKRLEMLVIGSVAPKIELQIAVKIAETFPIEFMDLTHEISELTGKGQNLVKPLAASQTIPA